MVLPKLVISNLVHRKTRVALTVAAIALSVSLVVAVTSGYASIEAAAYKFLTKYLGTTDATITPINYGTGVPESLVDQLRADPRVKLAVGRFETENAISDNSRIAEVIGIQPTDPQVRQMNMELGHWFDSATADDAVIDQAVAKLLDVQPGGKLVLPELDRKLTLTVVGIVHKPDVMASWRPTLYVPIHTLQKFKDFPNQLTRITIELNNRSSEQSFVSDWDAKLKTLDPNIRLRTAGEGREILGQNLQSLHLLSYMGGLVSMVAATFIVFSALSMGVTERQRTLAMLRAVGALRIQIARLVIVEGLLIAAVGAAVGILLGIFWISVLAWKFNKLFFAGVVVSPGGVALGAGGSMLAALAASLFPAWSASRVSPLEAMSPLAQSGKSRTPWVCAAIGLVLIAIDPFMLYGPSEKVLGWLGSSNPHQSIRLVKFYGHFAIGIPGVLLGFFLLSPMFVWAIETMLAPGVARLMGLHYALLRQQLSSGLWRAAGTCTALMVGLAVLIALQTEGHTAMNGWKLPDKFPDIFIVDFTGIDLAQAAKLDDVPGIAKGQVMPIAVVSPGLSADFWGMTQLMLMPDRTMFIGIDPKIGFNLMELDFREGNVKDAQRMLEEGRHVLVTTEFKQLKGLGLGDKLALKTTHGMVDYTIAGVVWSPGIDVIVSAFDMSRQMDQRTSASVFGSIADAKRDFGVTKFLLFAANLQSGIDKEVVLKNVQKELKAEGMRAGDVRTIKTQIGETFSRILLLVSTVAFAAMAVAALGVANTVMASIRSRRWQLGILRSIGVTRSQLLRLILAEAILLGLVGCALGVPCGLELAVDAEAVQIAITGYAPALSIPWNYVGIGMCVVLLVALAASLWPAAQVARSDTLELLQAGRAAA